MKARLDETSQVETLYAVTHERSCADTEHLLGKVQASLQRAGLWLLRHQEGDGHWVAELEGDTILESEYVLLLHFLGRHDDERIPKLCNYIIRHWISEDGGVPIYPGGPADPTPTVKAYFACKLAGHSVDEPFMVRLREAILRMGGVTQCNTFTKLYLSVFGQYDWDGVPTIPPELVLLPPSFALSIYSMSSWSRTILVPLAIINAFRPHRQVPPGCDIDELFVGGRHGRHLRLRASRKWLTWRNFFLVLDRLLKVYNASPIKPMRKKAMQAAEKYILDRQPGSGGVSAIFPAMTHAIMAFKCLGYPDAHPAVQHELEELRKFEIHNGDEIRLQPCVSPVWDTAIALNVMLDSGLSARHPAVERAVEWLLARQTTKKGDWAVKVPNVEPGGWYFEYANEFYPDVDDTIMVLMGLYKAFCPDGKQWSTAPERIRSSMERALKWTLAMQCSTGGWGAFDRDNSRKLFEEVPFADHNAMLDPATADITARVLEMLSFYGYGVQDPCVKRALSFLEHDQDADGTWMGRWGVNYLYGTWQVLRGLHLIGYDMGSPMVRRAVAWLKSVQNSDGGWGETCQSYDDPERYKGKGVSTASQTGWALMGLMNAGEVRSAEVRLGIDYLLRMQRPDGTWDEEEFTGTGFPCVFYLRYHLYGHNFAQWALAQYHQMSVGHPCRLELVITSAN